MSSFHGSITTTGKSEAIRLEKALFTLHPEFRQKAKVRAHVIAPGRALITVVDATGPVEREEDPVVEAFLAFLEQDMTTHPERVTPLPKRLVARASRLTRKVRVKDTDRLPKGVSF